MLWDVRIFTGGAIFAMNYFMNVLIFTVVVESNVRTYVKSHFGGLVSR